MVFGMPGFLAFLGATGTAAMIWVGGGIIVHGREEYGVHALRSAVHDAAAAAAQSLPMIGGAAEWIVTAALSGIVGLVLGAAAIPFTGFVVAPVWKIVKGVLRRPERIS